METKDFSNQVLLRSFEGGAVYTAERDGKYFVIQDESAALSMLDEEDAAGFEAQKVFEFPTASARVAYLRERGWISEATTVRGSRKHVLDWTGQPEFCVELLQLVEPVDVRISARSKWMPRGHGATEEARLETFGPSALPDIDVWTSLRAWWLVHDRGANTPNWDIALACEIEGRPGLVLVEAKANLPELSPAGKLLDAAASEASRANHGQIKRAIEEACAQLRHLEGSVAISHESHYQLSNRIAFAWKLAALGVPTVLVYLGFTGDTGISDAGAPFTDERHWRRAFGEYAHGLVPESLFDQRIECGAASTWFLVRSRQVLEISQARPTKVAGERFAP